MALSLPGRKKDPSTPKNDSLRKDISPSNKPEQQKLDKNVEWSRVLRLNEGLKCFEVEFPITGNKYTVSTMDILSHLKAEPDHAARHLDALNHAQKADGSHDRYLQVLAKEIAVKWAQEELLAGRSLYRHSPEMSLALEKLNMFDRKIMDAFDKVREFCDNVPEMMSDKAYEAEKQSQKKIQTSFRDEAEVLLYQNFKIKENIEMDKYPSKLELWTDMKSSVDAINAYLGKIKTLIE